MSTQGAGVVVGSIVVPSVVDVSVVVVDVVVVVVAPKSSLKMQERSVWIPGR